MALRYCTECILFTYIISILGGSGTKISPKFLFVCLLFANRDKQANLVTKLLFLMQSDMSFYIPFSLSHHSIHEEHHIINCYINTLLYFQNKFLLICKQGSQRTTLSLCFSWQARTQLFIPQYFSLSTRWCSFPLSRSTSVEFFSSQQGKKIATVNKQASLCVGFASAQNP